VIFITSMMKHAAFKIRENYNYEGYQRLFTGTLFRVKLEVFLNKVSGTVGEN
jgi:hypothetical protein